jgi:hypothetical protein
VRIGFLNNQIDNRGTGNALYDYAHYNEEILGNKSLIFTHSLQGADEGMRDKLVKRFGIIYASDALNHYRSFYSEIQIDALYHIKYGNDDGFRGAENVPYLAHAVFDASQPHGDVYAAISRWLGERHSVPWVPHIIAPQFGVDNLRERLEIPESALVFGRHGGRDTFDIPWVWNAIIDTLRERDDVYFLFLNTDIPDYLRPTSPTYTRWTDRIIELPATVDPHEKYRFIRTCNAMLHARQRGETFGIAVGEFVAAGLPIITYGLSPEKAHYQEIDQPTFYFGPEGLREILIHWEAVMSTKVFSGDRSYRNYTPDYVMDKFRKVFLNENTWDRNRATLKRGFV